MISITIEGETASGKTAVAQVIIDALEAKGLTVEGPDGLNAKTFFCEKRSEPLLKSALANAIGADTVQVLEKNLPRGHSK